MICRLRRGSAKATSVRFVARSLTSNSWKVTTSPHGVTEVAQRKTTARCSAVSATGVREEGDEVKSESQTGYVQSDVLCLTLLFEYHVRIEMQYDFTIFCNLRISHKLCII